MEIAYAWGTSPADWWDEDDATIATALDVLEQVAERSRG